MQFCQTDKASKIFTSPPWGKNYDSHPQHFIIVWKSLKWFRSGVRSASFPNAFVSFLLTDCETLTVAITDTCLQHMGSLAFTGLSSVGICWMVSGNSSWGLLERKHGKYQAGKWLTFGKICQFTECKWMCFLVNSTHEVFNTTIQQICSPYYALILLMFYIY